MPRLLEKTWLTEDEAYDPACDVRDMVEQALADLKLDSYNFRYVVHLTVDTVDEPKTEQDDES